MRTAIFIAGLMIAESVQHKDSPTWDNKTYGFIALLFVCFAFMDIVDFLGGMC